MNRHARLGIGIAALGVSVAGMCFGLVMNAVAGTKESTSHTYEGEVSRGEPLSLRVTKVDGRNSSAKISVRLTLLCEDGTNRGVRIPPLRARFVSETGFTGQRYTESPSGDWTFFEVRGRVRDRVDEARGILYYIEEPFDPPPADEPDCAVSGSEAEWEARG